MKEIYQMTKTEVRKEINGGLHPLTNTQVLERQKKFGPNELEEGKKKGKMQIFLEQFKDFLVIILILAATISGFLGDWESTLVILVVITMNAILGTVQTLKAEQSLKSLKALSSPEAKVLRDGRIVKVPSSQLVPGDEVYLEAGDAVPADG
ncbi:MAG: cation-transporting P-type ATPase, partial [Candidatus Fimousia sp.]